MKTEADWLEGLASEVADRAAEDFRDRVTHFTAACQSPIERIMAAALIIECPEGVSAFTKAQSFDSLLHGAALSVDWVGALYPQASVGPYIADFLLEAFDRHDGKLRFVAIIECDGHEFHERTKEQARHDKRRDRWFQTRGISVLRFTGSEIWDDPLGCAVQAYDAFWARVSLGWPNRDDRK